MSFRSDRLGKLPCIWASNLGLQSGPIMLSKEKTKVFKKKRHFFKPNRLPYYLAGNLVKWTSPVLIFGNRTPYIGLIGFKTKSILDCIFLFYPTEKILQAMLTYKILYN